MAAWLISLLLLTGMDRLFNWLTPHPICYLYGAAGWSDYTPRLDPYLPPQSLA